VESRGKTWAGAGAAGSEGQRMNAGHGADDRLS
jgi:hypothetical protein